MKILMAVAVLLLVAGIVKNDVILGALALSSLLFAGAASSRFADSPSNALQRRKPRHA